MKLTREQELALVDLGMLYLLQQHFNPGANARIINIQEPVRLKRKYTKRPKKSMSKAERKKISIRMKQMWAQKRLKDR